MGDRLAVRGRHERGLQYSQRGELVHLHSAERDGVDFVVYVCRF